MTTTTAKESRSDLRMQAFDQILGQLEAAQFYGRSEVTVLGIAGCTAGDGASLITESLSVSLARRIVEKVLRVDSVDLLSCSNLAPADLLNACFRAGADNLWRFSRPRGTDASFVDRPGVAAGVGETISVLASEYRFILVDCGALIGPSNLWDVARVLHNVLLVVAAGETNKTQITYAQRLVEKSGVHLAGFILNKRTYPLPQWLYRVLA
jgi:hypothetical protein